jgi:excisionase family DNA binding protein
MKREKKKEEKIREGNKEENKNYRGASNEGREGLKMGEGLFFEKLMTVEELADALGLAPQTIRNWVAMRRLPYLRIGGRTRFRRESLEAWLLDQEKKPCQ